MSASKSNLSNPKYGYDMVVAVTQTSLNSHLKEWVHANIQTPFTQVWMAGGSQGLTPVLTDYEDVKKQLGFDPFSVGEDDKKDQQTMYDKNFWFGFQAKLGIPRGSSPTNSPAIIKFNEQGAGAHVTYNMVFESFRIVNLQAGRGNHYAWKVFDQSDDTEPWVFSYDVNLNLQDGHLDINKLPPATQKEIKNLGSDMFSLKQLFLDLNNSYLSSLPNSPTINGLKNYMCGSHLMPYIESLRTSIEKSGGGALGSGAVAKPAITLPKPTFIPTDLNFEISSYKDANGQTDTNEQAAYTLNYLVMGYKHQMPPAVPFTWNWVDSNQLSQYAGAVSIRKELFFDFLYNIFSKALPRLYVSPYATTECKCGLGSLYTFKLQEPYDQPPPVFKKINQGDHWLSYSFQPPTAKAQASVGCEATVIGGVTLTSKIEVTYSVQSDVYVKGNQITVKTTAKIYADIEGRFEVILPVLYAKGYFANFTDTRIFALGVDSYGKLQVTLEGPGLVDNSSTPEKEQFASICTRIRSSARDRLAGMLQGYETEILNGLSGAYGWVFPGGQTFAFEDLTLSDSEDLVANVNYVAIN